MNLSAHFTLEEFVESQTAARRGIDNTPSPDAFDAMKDLCEAVLEPLREALGPVRISSGYRCEALNRAIGGSGASQHCKGQAADISVPGRSLAEVFNWIQAHADYDQLIREFPPRGWVHVSYIKSGVVARKSSLLATIQDGRTVYTPWKGPVTT